MSNFAIKVENLGKLYQIGELENYYTLRDSLTNIVKYPFKLMSNNHESKKKPEIEYIWALKDINFEVKHGEIIGIIGRNGAGKSTLLKILSRITTPTEGRVEINGKVGSLLEVGTGFHPELTGRENIFLNGSILGMSKKEIERKFDIIVEFAEIEKFLDTPVKRYSSGMYVRLAFAVAAHLESEILIVDEVLAVGDIEFQKKCLGKMSDVAKQERTVLFVSHNINAINNICEKCIYLNMGKINLFADTNTVVNKYLKDISNSSNKLNTFKNDKIFYYSSELDVLNFYACNKELNPKSNFLTSEKIFINVSINLRKKIPLLRIGIDFIDSISGVIFRSFDNDVDQKEHSIGQLNYLIEIPANLLYEGSYEIRLQIADHRTKWIVVNKIIERIEVQNIDGVNSFFKDRKIGVIMPKINWISIKN